MPKKDIEASKTFPSSKYNLKDGQKVDFSRPGPSNAYYNATLSSSVDGPLLSSTNQRYSTAVISRIKKSIAADRNTSIASVDFAPEDGSLVAKEEADDTKELLSAIRSLPRPMEEKRLYREELLKVVPVSDSNLPFNAYYKYMTVKKKTKEMVGFLQQDTNLWSSSLKLIEGRFGTGVVSYFVFLRWLLFLNLVIFILMFLFIVLPHSISSNYTGGRNITFGTSETDSSDIFDRIVTQEARLSQTTVSKDSRQSPERKPKSGSVLDNLGSLLNTYNVDGLLEATLYSSPTNNSSKTRKRLVNYCQDVYQKLLKNISGNNFLSKAEDFLDGSNWLETTVLFTGHYESMVTLGSSFTYNIGVAFIIVVFALVFVNLFLMLSYASTGVQESMLKSLQEMYCYITFCGWDFCIADEGSAKRHHNSVHQEFISTLAEGRRKAMTARWTTNHKVMVYAIRIAAHLVTLLILVGAYYLLFFVTSVQLKAQRKGNLDIVTQYLPPLTITGLNFLFPLIVYILIPFEEYNVEEEINIKLIRIILLRESSIVILLSSFYNQITCAPKDMCGKGLENCPSPLCWETYVGQQIYRLILMDLLVHIAVTFLFETPRYYVCQKWHNKLTEMLGLPLFDIPTQVLALVYSQTLSWLGAFFSPLLPAINCIKLVIFFYLKKFTVLEKSVPDPIAYKASRSNAIFVVVLMLSFFITVGVNGYALTQIATSPGCGPFRYYTHMVSALRDAADDYAPAAYETLTFIFSPLVGFPIIVLQCLALYYYVTKKSAHQRIVKLLKVQLTLEGTDKQFLLNRLTKMKPDAAGTLDKEEKPIWAKKDA